MKYEFHTSSQSNVPRKQKLGYYVLSLCGFFCFFFFFIRLEILIASTAKHSVFSSAIFPKKSQEIDFKNKQQSSGVNYIIKQQYFSPLFICIIVKTNDAAFRLELSTMESF